MTLSFVELMHLSKFCFNCVLYGHIYFVYIDVRNAYSNKHVSYLFSNYRFICCLFDMTSYSDALISWHDMARIWRNKVIPIVMLPLYYHVVITLHF